MGLDCRVLAACARTLKTYIFQYLNKLSLGGSARQAHISHVDRLDCAAKRAMARLMNMALQPANKTYCQEKVAVTPRQLTISFANL